MADIDVGTTTSTGRDGRLLVFGGPYSNLRALTAMREVAGALAIPPERIICTGDVVAYCAEPEETAQAVRDWGIGVVAGNCEEQLARGAADCGCGFAEGSACERLARDWYDYANHRISPETRDWMAGLPARLDFSAWGRRFAVVHGGITRNNRFIFESDRDAIAEELALSRVDVVVAGHCGLPFVARSGAKAWFNAGVIGLPANDGTCEGWYGLLAPAADGAIDFSTHRLAYDHAGAAAAVRMAGRADGYAETLQTGIWPSLDVLPRAEQARTGTRLAVVTVHLPALGDASTQPHTITCL